MSENGQCLRTWPMTPHDPPTNPTAAAPPTEQDEGRYMALCARCTV